MEFGTSDEMSGHSGRNWDIFFGTLEIWDIGLNIRLLVWDIRKICQFSGHFHCS